MHAEKKFRFKLHSEPLKNVICLEISKVKDSSVYHVYQKCH